MEEVLAERVLEVHDVEERVGRRKDALTEEVADNC